MRALAQQMRAQAQAALASRSSARIGLVTAYDPDHYAVKVAIQPEGTETGWMPIGTAWLGNGWGIVCPPSIGDQVEIVPVEGQSEAWVMSQRFFSDGQRPPTSVPSGEFLLQHQTGSLLHFFNDGSVSVVTSGALSVTSNSTTMVNSTGTMTLTAPTVNLKGNFNVTGNTTFAGTVKANGHAIDDTHRHTGVKAGSDTSGVPL